MHLNLSADEALTTTRAVRKRLELGRPVDPADIRECLEIALQAPTGSNRQIWHFVVVTDPATITKVGELYDAPRPSPNSKSVCSAHRIH
jgi:nitroreductase